MRRKGREERGGGALEVEGKVKLGLEISLILSFSSKEKRIRGKLIEGE